MKKLIYCAVITALISSCVSTKKYNGLTNDYRNMSLKYDKLYTDYKNCQSETKKLVIETSQLNNEIDGLKKENKNLKTTNDQTLSQLEELSVISSHQAETIKKTLDNIGNKDSYIQTLQQRLAYKDSLNFILVMNLKGALNDINDKDIEVKVDKGVVYIDISDNLLFKSGKYEVTPEAEVVLGKVAKVLKNNPDIEFMVEGHTDNVPYFSGQLIDNWDLSVKRATSVIRILQYQHGLNPQNMIAAGRGEYNPKVENTSESSRKLNRVTRIKILPKLDQFFQLYEQNSITPKATRE